MVPGTLPSGWMYPVRETLTRERRVVPEIYLLRNMNPREVGEVVGSGMVPPRRDLRSRAAAAGPEAGAALELERIHRELAARLAPEQLSAFISEEIRGSTDKLIDSMERLDKRLSTVKEVTGIHARQFNDPTGDWKVDDSILHFTTLTPRPQDQLPDREPASTIPRNERYNKLVLEEAKRLEDEAEARRLRKAMRGGSGGAGGSANRGRGRHSLVALGDEGVPDVNEVLRKNIDLARALYVKEREALELSSLELENVELRRALMNRESSWSESERQREVERRLYADDSPSQDLSYASAYSSPVNRHRNQEALDRRQDDRTEDILFQQRSEAYNYLQQRVARKLARDNRVKRERNSGPKSPPSWAIKTHASARKQSAKEKAQVGGEQGRNRARSRSKRKGRSRAKGRRQTHHDEVFDDDGNQSRGHFNSIEMSFGASKSVDEQEEDEILARYPVSHEFSHLGTQSSKKGAPIRGTKKALGSVFNSSMSDDMIKYLARVRKKENQKAKIRSERLKATAYFSKKFGQ